MTATTSSVQEIFQDCAKMLTERQDVYESFVKESRDITVHSKRLIFFIQRVPGSKKPFAELMEEACATEKKITEMVVSLGKRLAAFLDGEIDSPHAFSHFRNAFVPGLEEFIEAKLFLAYLKNDRVIPSMLDLNMELVDGGAPPLIDLATYMGGLCDMTGEVMRLCIGYAATGDLDKPFEILEFFRDVQRLIMSMHEADTGGTAGWLRKLGKKIEVFEQSLSKVEKACFKIRSKCLEFPELAKSKDFGKSIFQSAPAGGGGGGGGGD